MTPIPVAVRSKKWVCGRSFAGIAVSIPVSVLCCRVEVCGTGRSPVLRSVVCVCVCVWYRNVDNEETLTP